MTNNKLKDWELERFLLGELPPWRMEEIKKLIEDNPEIQRRITLLQKSSEDILNQYPSDSLIPEILKRYEEDRSRESIKKAVKPFGWKRFLYAVPVLAGALFLIFVVFSNRGTLPPDTRIKGEESIDFSKTQIILYRKTADDVEILADGDRVAAGDLLQIAYVPGEKTYGVIFSIDGNGVVTLHYPEDKESSALLKQEKKVLLGNSYELDDAPRYERFFFITAGEEIVVQPILEQAKIFADSTDSVARGYLELSQTYSQFSILLNKGDRR